MSSLENRLGALQAGNKHYRRYVWSLGKSCVYHQSAGKMFQYDITFCGTILYNDHYAVAAAAPDDRRACKHCAIRQTTTP